jgi:LPS sulfotransferase NodH
MAAGKSVIFCATPRTGSTLIYDDFLNIAGAMAPPSEMLYDMIIAKKTTQEWSEAWEELAKLKDIQGAFIEKVMFHYTPMISRFIEAGSIDGVGICTEFKPELFDGFFDFFANATWVYIERRDVFSQAVSMYIAEKSNVWYLRQDTNRRMVKPTELQYDFKRIKSYLSSFLTGRSQWQEFFSHYKVEPVRIYYEDAVESYPNYLDELFAQSGLEKIQSNPPRRFLKQGTELNEKWARWLRDDILLDLYGRSLPES